MKNSSNLNISCKVVFSLNKWNKKVRSPSSFGRKRPFISLNSSASIGNLSSSERARASARANHAKNDAQKGCAMQLNGITLIVQFSQCLRHVPRIHHSNDPASNGKQKLNKKQKTKKQKTKTHIERNHLLCLMFCLKLL